MTERPVKLIEEQYAKGSKALRIQGCLSLHH
jgi:hypothetical protein